MVLNKSKITINTTDKICKNCKWWCPYNKIWGDCSRRVPQYNIKFDDTCDNFEEKDE